MKAIFFLDKLSYDEYHNDEVEFINNHSTNADQWKSWLVSKLTEHGISNPTNSNNFFLGVLIKDSTDTSIGSLLKTAKFLDKNEIVAWIEVEVDESNSVKLNWDLLRYVMMDYEIDDPDDPVDYRNATQEQKVKSWDKIFTDEHDTTIVAVFSIKKDPISQVYSSGI